MNIISRIKNRLNRIQYLNSLKVIEKFRDIDGWLTDFEAYGLYSVSKQIPSKSIVVEIGSWKGKSTYCIAKGLRKSTIYAIDPFNAAGESGSKEIYETNKGLEPLVEQFRNNIKLAKTTNKVEVLQGYSNQFANHFQKIDFLFIDGDHSIEGCKYDYLTFSPFVKVGGLLAFHDYYEDRNDLGPTWVIKNLVNENSHFTFYKQFNSLWIAKRIS